MQPEIGNGNGSASDSGSDNGNDNNAMVEENVDVQIHSNTNGSKPLQVGLTVQVLVQIVLGAVGFGTVYATTRGQLEAQGQQIEELRRERIGTVTVNQQMLDRLARIEEQIGFLRDESRRGRR